MLLHWYEIFCLPTEMTKLIMSYDSRPIQPKGILMMESSFVTFDTAKQLLYWYDFEGRIKDIQIPLKQKMWSQYAGHWTLFVFADILVLQVGADPLDDTLDDVTICLNQQTKDWCDGIIRYTWAQQCAMRLHAGDSPFEERMFDQDVVGVHVKEIVEDGWMAFIDGGKTGHVLQSPLASTGLSRLQKWCKMIYEREQGKCCSSRYTLHSPKEVILLGQHIFSLSINDIRNEKPRLHVCAKLPASVSAQAISSHGNRLILLSTREILIYTKSSLVDYWFNTYQLTKSFHVR